MPVDHGDSLLSALRATRYGLTVDDLVGGLVDQHNRAIFTRPQVERWLLDHPELVDFNGKGWVMRAQSTVVTTPERETSQAGTPLALARRELEMERATIRRQRSSIVALQGTVERQAEEIARLKEPSGRKAAAWMEERQGFLLRIAGLEAELATARAALAARPVIAPAPQSERVAPPPAAVEIPAPSRKPAITQRRAYGPDHPRSVWPRLRSAIVAIAPSPSQYATISGIAERLGITTVAIVIALKRYAPLVDVDKSVRPHRVRLRMPAAA